LVFCNRISPQTNKQFIAYLNDRGRLKLLQLFCTAACHEILEPNCTSREEIIEYFFQEGFI
jgi:hypothetical protein